MWFPVSAILYFWHFWDKQRMSKTKTNDQAMEKRRGREGIRKQKGDSRGRNGWREREREREEENGRKRKKEEERGRKRKRKREEKSRELVQNLTDRKKLGWNRRLSLFLLSIRSATKETTALSLAKLSLLLFRFEQKKGGKSCRYSSSE